MIVMIPTTLGVELSFDTTIICPGWAMTGVPK